MSSNTKSTKSSFDRKGKPLRWLPSMDHTHVPTNPHAKLVPWKGWLPSDDEKPPFEVAKAISLELAQGKPQVLMQESVLLVCAGKETSFNFNSSQQGNTMNTQESKKVARTVTSHHINACNRKNLIFVTSERHPVSNASNEYVILVNEAEVVLKFQDGPVEQDGAGTNGVTHEALLAILIDRLESFQSGAYACEENQKALDHLKAAVAELASRTTARQNRGVEGQHIV